MRERMVRWLGVVLVAALVMVLLPVGSVEAQGPVLFGSITNAYVLNVRSGPGVAYDVVRKVTLGEQVALVGRNANGSWVELQGGGWINAYYVSTAGSIFGLPDTSGSVAPAPGIPAVVTGAVYLNTRTGPGVGYPVNQRLVNGQRLLLIARSADGRWVQIASGSVEWVNAYYLTIYGDRFSLPVSGATGAPGGAASTDPYMATIVNAFYVNVRSGPSAGFGIVRRVAKGDVERLVGRNADGSWVQLQSVTGGEEWINAGYVRTNGGVIANLPVTSNTLPSGAYTPPGGTGTTSGVRTHVVQAGENLFRISLRYGVSLAALAAANGIVDYNRVYAGQVLVIP
ncbi:MAG: C40 family peptidase [Anaerolineae bacterium]